MVASYFFWLQIESFDGDERNISIGEDIDTRLINSQISVIVSGVWGKPHNRSKCWLTRVVMASACSLRFCAKIRANSHQTSATFISNAICGKNANERFFFSLSLNWNRMSSIVQANCQCKHYEWRFAQESNSNACRSGDGVEKTQFSNRRKSREFSGTRNATALQRNSWNCVQWYADWKSDISHAQINAT